MERLRRRGKTESGDGGVQKRRKSDDGGVKKRRKKQILKKSHHWWTGELPPVTDLNIGVPEGAHSALAACVAIEKLSADEQFLEEVRFSLHRFKFMLTGQWSLKKLDRPTSSS